MRDKGQLTLIEILAIIILALIMFLIVAGFLGKEPSQDYKLEDCVRRYNDFEYCKYRLGLNNE